MRLHGGRLLTQPPGHCSIAIPDSGKKPSKAHLRAHCPAPPFAVQGFFVRWDKTKMFYTRGKKTKMFR
ncbi:hypothetical protein DWUX_2056 [Desulfovibrio diazotrophicus]|nr:hypothetical protein DWUX_2056 [Desulfovibrio diazotrophicus]